MQFKRLQALQYSLQHLPVAEGEALQVLIAEVPRPPVRRVDNAYGDRNLICACPPIEMYAEAASE